MNLKKITGIFILAIMIVSQFSFINFGTVVKAVSPESKAQKANIATRYFYNQLTDEAKQFYHAMEKMNEKGMFKTGKDSLDLTNTEEEGYEKYFISQEQLENYAKGSQDLLNSMGAAKDAFEHDNPEIFYVDFDYISLRVTLKEGTYHAYLGTGRSDNYYLAPFDSADKVNTAIEKVNEELEKAVSAMPTQETIKEGQDLTEQQIIAAHNYVIEHAMYKLETDVTKPEYASQVRTVYGGFVNHEIVCEGYARTFKMILDKLGIPCVLVTGVYRHSESVPELHMWTNVQLYGKWYGVDVTFDDPSGENELKSGKETTEYLLVGEDKMGAKHVPTGILSTANFEFSYPMMELNRNKYEEVYAQNGLVVEMDDENYDEVDDVAAALFKVSYNDKGWADNAKEGKYIIARADQYYPNNNTWSLGEWSYMPAGDLFGVMDKTETVETGDGQTKQRSYLQLYSSNCVYIEIGITDVKPDFHGKRPDGTINGFAYYGSETSILVRSGKIFNPNGDYVAPPHVKKMSPISSGTMYIGTTYHCTVTYDDILVPKEGEKPNVEVSILNQSNPGSKYYKLENFNFDGRSTYTFDFTPSEMFGDDSVFYVFKFTGVVGSRSGKEPFDASYLCAHRCCAYAYRAQGYDFNVFGKPTLLENSDLSTSDWEMNDGGQVKDALKHRLALVATTTTGSQDKSMKDAINKELEKELPGAELDESTAQTFNINLTLCKSQVIKTGDGVRVSVGFPPGYGPEDEGVTFKAYHFGTNDDGTTYVEEIDCVVTKLGLIITCKSFSPFAIVAVNTEKVSEEDKEKLQNSNKTVVIEKTQGGKIQNVNETDEIQEADEIINLTAEETGEQSKKIKIVPNDGYAIDEIVLGDSPIEVTNEESMEVKLDYENLSSETATILKVAYVANSVHNAEETRQESVVAQPVVANPTITTSMTTSNSEALKPGDEFDVTVSIDSLNEVGDGILSIGGKLEYDKEKLTMESIKGLGKWNLSEEYVNTENFQFITDSSEKIKTAGELFTVKFKVKEEIEESTITSIRLVGVTAGLGMVKTQETTPTVATASDIQKTIDIKVDKEPKAPPTPYLDSTKYDIDEYFSYVREVLPGTKVSDMKNDIAVKLIGHEDTEGLAKPTMILKNPAKGDAGETTLTDENIVGTGTTVTIGDVTYTIIVAGDIDGDGDIGVLDISNMKSQYVGKISLKGIQLAATDADLNGEDAGVNDLAVMKNYYVNKLPE